MRSSFLAFLFIMCMLTGFSQSFLLNNTPRHYLCYRTEEPILTDGKLDEDAWSKAAWTDYFVDIQGSAMPAPLYGTRVKMLWDDRYLYVAAELEEPHVWATLTERESVIFYDPDFEVFIDPDGDTHHYIEYEMNALNTQWDLMLLKPYRDDTIHNVAIDNWSYNGIRSGVFVNGTINDPKDIDKSWTLEIAFPLDALSEVSAAGRFPVPGDQYRIDFSRVEWQVEVKDGKYVRKTHRVNGVEKPLPEDNWVWSPQGVIAMHQPETWGIVQFSGLQAGKGTDEFRPDPDDEWTRFMRLLYYREIAWFGKTGRYSQNPDELGFAGLKSDGIPFVPEIRLTFTGYEARVASMDGKRYLYITEDGRSWKEGK